MKILVTGAAGFIGYHLCEKLIKDGFHVLGLDNVNDYYDTGLKYQRLSNLGIDREDASQYLKPCSSKKFGERMRFVRMNLEDKKALPKLFSTECFNIVCNLAAQAGVRYSLSNPQAYVDCNINGFFNLLECCRNHSIEHFIYGSSSSVYGLNEKIPFGVNDKVDRPISIYAASKKTNELMAHTYSHLFEIPTTGLRFFTVYGPWGRPDMATFLFTDSIIRNKPIKVFNYGKMERDFTFIEDIIEGIFKIIQKPIDTRDNYKIYNIGNTKSIKLLDFLNAIENALKIDAKKEFLPIQPGDVIKTWADVENLKKDYDYSPRIPYTIGVKKYVEWHLSYYAN